MDLEPLKIDRGRTRPTRRRPPWLVPVLLGLGALFSIVLFRGPLWRGLDRLRLPTVRVALVTESHPASVAAVSGTAANGHVVAARRAALSTDLPGRIVELNVTEGSVVRKGDVVARLFAGDYEAALARAEADLSASRAALARALAAGEAAAAAEAAARRRHEAAAARLDEGRSAERLALSDRLRAARLVEEGVSPPRELEAAEAGSDGARARSEAASAELRAAEASVRDATAGRSVAGSDIELARAQVGAAEAARDEAEARLQKTVVRAPFDGIVVLKDAEVGEVVSPSSQAGSNARGSVCMLVDFGSLEVQADVPETSLAMVRVGSAVRVFLDAWPEQSYSGRVERIWPTANRQKATVEVRASLDEPDERLRPDMGVRVVFLPAGAGEGDAAGSGESGMAGGLLVPESALVRSEGRTGVLVVERDRVRLQLVATGERRSGRVAIRSGLQEGQLVVIDPPADLADGDRVLVEGS